MKTNIENPDKTVAALIHLSTFSKFMFPLGNFIVPLILWTAKKQDHFVDEHGKQAINFQISIFLYFILLLCIGIAGVVLMGMELGLADPLIISEHSVKFARAAEAIPFLIIIGIVGTLMLTLLIFEIVVVITATIKASEGQFYQYPISINFIKPSSPEEHQSKNEQFNNNTQNQRL